MSLVASVVIEMGTREITGSITIEETLQNILQEVEKK